MVSSVADDVQPSADEIPPEEERMSSKEARDEFGLTYPQVSGWWKTGAIPYWRIGPYVFLRRRDVEERVRRLREIRPGSPKGSIRQSSETHKPD